MKKFAISIPNIITIARIVLTPLFVIFLLRGAYLSALLVFSFAAISDGIDGFLARYFNQRTELGAFLDPIADKLLLTTAFVAMAVIQFIPAWLTVIVISRDVTIVLGIAVFTLTHTQFTVQPSIISKITTFAQLITIGLALLVQMINIVPSITTLFYWIAAILTVLSGGHYLYKGMLKLQHGPRNTPTQKS